MKKILVIEDSRALAQILVTSIAKELNLQCDVATNTADAKALLTEHHKSYVAITADLNHPGSPNGEIIDVVEPFGVPCIVLTGDISQEKRARILKSRVVCDYIFKSSPSAFDNILNQLYRLTKNVNIHALVVDDSNSIRQLLVDILGAHNIESTSVTSAEQALEYVKAHPETNLVITDGEMKEKNGIELTYELRGLFTVNQMVIIGISGVYSRDQSIQFIKAGANDFLTKPIMVEEFVTRLNSTLNTMEQVAELHNISEDQKHTLHMVAHDVRDPLANIFSLANLLLEDRPIDPQKCNEFIPLIHDSSQSLIELLQRLTELSNVTNAEVATQCLDIDIDALIVERINALAHSAENKSILVQPHLASGVKVNCDPMLISQVFVNLLSNALKFSPPNTSIIVNSQVINNRWYFEVLDEGVGVLKNESDKLFQAFSALSAKPTAGESSSGLGLAICKKIVEKHYGSIGYKPNPSGVGSCFYFYLPL